jgi:hypothetical protein
VSRILDKCIVFRKVGSEVSRVSASYGVPETDKIGKLCWHSVVFIHRARLVMLYRRRS